MGSWCQGWCSDRSVVATRLLVSRPRICFMDFDERKTHLAYRNISISSDMVYVYAYPSRCQGEPICVCVSESRLSEKGSDRETTTKK